MPKNNRVMGARIGNLRDVYRAWKTKNPIDSQTRRRPPFRIAVGVSPKVPSNGKTLEETQKE